MATRLALGRKAETLAIVNPKTIVGWHRRGFGQRCREMGVRPSLGSVGDAYDNAMCVSFFATLECELLDRRTFKNQREARHVVFRFIEAWYNPLRRHSALDYRSPINYEKSFSETQSLPVH